MNRSFLLPSLPFSRGALFALLLAGAGLFWTGCDVGAIDDDLGLIINFSPAPTTVAGQILDAKTQLPIEAAPVTVRFSGPDAGRVVDVSGEVMTAVTLPDISLLNFNVDGDEPTPETPATINLQISAPNYLTTNERVVVTSSDHLFTANLTNVLDPPSGVEAVVRQFATSGGAPVDDVSVTTDPEDETGAQASLRIPRGTVMRDKDGRTLGGGATATVVYFSNQNDAALGAFPGGLMGVDVRDREVGSFVTAGFAAVEVVDAQGREARQFDGPIEVGVDVSPSTLNPQTGRRVEPGDEIPVFSFDADTGEWTAEGQTKATLASSAKGKSSGLLATTIQTQHLTYWNLDWHYEGKCSVAGRQIFEGIPPRWRGRLRWVLRGDATNDPLNRGNGFYRSGYHTEGDFLKFANAPSNWPMTFELIDTRNNGQVLAEGEISDLCTDKTWSVDAPPLENQVSLEVEVSVTCDADEEIRPDDYTIWYYSRPNSDWGSVKVDEGEAEISVIDGAVYEFSVFLEDEWETLNVRIDPEAKIQDSRVTVTDLERDDSEDGVEYEVTVNFRDTNGAVC
jgi:hypothetical protein